MWASSLLKLMSLNTGWPLTSATPSPLQPRRCLGSLVSNCGRVKIESIEAPRIKKKTQKSSIIMAKEFRVAKSTSTSTKSLKFQSINQTLLLQILLI